MRKSPNTILLSYGYKYEDATAVYCVNYDQFMPGKDLAIKLVKIKAKIVDVPETK